MNGGYDEGYRQCPCFWGTEPGSVVRELCGHIPSFDHLSVLDAGCGEGKNAVFLAAQGATVDAIDISALAVENGLKRWSGCPHVRWMVGDIQTFDLRERHYDVVIAYGLLHCLPRAQTVLETIARLQRATRMSGYNIVCAFNDRRQELHAHPGFKPSLLPHAAYVSAYASWEVLMRTDTDLTERHPHNQVEHTHSMTRILARRILP